MPFSRISASTRILDFIIMEDSSRWKVFGGVGRGISLGTISYIEVKPWDGMTPSEGGKANGTICVAPGSTTDSGEYLKWFYINAYSIRNKLNELESLVLSQRYDIIGIESHNSSAGMEGYWLFRKDKQDSRK